MQWKFYVLESELILIPKYKCIEHFDREGCFINHKNEHRCIPCAKPIQTMYWASDITFQPLRNLIPSVPPEFTKIVPWSHAFYLHRISRSLRCHALFCATSWNSTFFYGCILLIFFTRKTARHLQEAHTLAKKHANKQTTLHQHRWSNAALKESNRKCAQDFPQATRATRS